METAQNFSNATLNDWWARTGEWVEEPNQRRGGASGVQLLAPSTAQHSNLGYTASGKWATAFFLCATPAAGLRCYGKKTLCKR